MTNKTCLGVIVVAVYSCASISANDGVLPIRNSATTPVELWIWPKSIGAYNVPMFLNSNGRGELHYLDGEIYWLLARDDRLREVPIGWINVSQTVREHPGIELNVRKVFEYRTATQEYNAWDSGRRIWIRQFQTRTFPESRLELNWNLPLQPMLVVPNQ